MKKSILFFSTIFLCFLLLQGCLEDKCTSVLTYTKYEPVYLLTEDIRIDIQGESPRTLQDPGKIYFYQNYVFINEVREGVHIINNENPENPTPVAFIPIPGNVDIVIKGNVLYADNYMDLLAINISNPTNPVLLKRVENVFDWYDYNEDFGYNVYYQQTSVTEKVDCQHYYWGVPFFFEGDVLFADQNSGFPSTVNVSNNAGQAQVVGTAGSMARFGISGNHMYAIDESYLDVFSIEDLTCPEFLTTSYVGWNIETIFPHGDHLFIGSETGMYIFDNTNPAAPVQQSFFEHARACDPVYVSGDRAFVTLRDGTPCEGFANQMDIVNIEDLSNPWLMKSYEMDHPHGLSVTPSNKLFLCEGTNGIKILDVSDTYNVTQTGILRGFDAYDVIALGENHIMVIGKDGFYQFDTTDPNNVQELSSIQVGQ